VLDVRTVGIVAGIDLASKPDAVGRRVTEAMEKAFGDEGLLIRVTGETIALSPPLIVSESQIGEIFGKLGKVLRTLN
jgi:beta-alanine--pyruvate transaminase